MSTRNENEPSTHETDSAADAGSESPEEGAAAMDAAEDATAGSKRADT